MLGFTRRSRSFYALAALAGSAGLAALPTSGAYAAPTGNACYNTATAAIAPVAADFSANVPASVGPGDTVNVTGLAATVTMPGAVFVSGYNLGLVQNGGSVTGKIKAVLAGSNTVEGQQETTLVNATLGPISISDPDGNPGTGDETADAVSTTVSFADMAWTSNGGGNIDIREASVPISNAAGGGGLQIDANLGFTVKFRCSPGTVDTAANTASWTTAAPFASTSVVTPAAAPVAGDDNASVGANQAASINVLANDSDVNGDIDPASVTVVSQPTSGTAAVNADGTITYTNTAAAASDSFTYTVADQGGLVSNAATVSVAILGDTCTDSGCDLDQVIEIQVDGASMSMKQAGSLITLPKVTLNGKPQKAMGELNGLTIVNARGTDAGWSVTGQMTTDLSISGTAACPANNPATWSNKCIPAANVGWAPSAQVAHDVIYGDVATVSAGAVKATGGLNEASELCSAPEARSGGTFTCGGAIGLGIPASAAAGLYKGTLTLTLV